MKVSRRAFVAGLAAALVPVMAPVALAATGGPVELAPRAGDEFSGVEAINDHGTVVGESYPRDVRILNHPAKWSVTGELTALPTLGGATGQAVAVNQDDVAVGWAEDDGGVQRAVRWAADGAVIRLPGTAATSAAGGISDTGRTVGWDYDGTAAHPLRWEPDGGVVRLPGLPGGGSAWAEKITPDGRVIAGTAVDAGGHTHAVRWDGRGRITDLTPGAEDSRVAAISRSGAIAGALTESGTTRPVRWDRSGAMVRLAWPDGVPAQAMAIDDTGTVVGLGYPDFDGTVGVRWDRSGTPTTLPSDTRGAQARAINRSGTIAGTADNAGVLWHRDGSRTRLDPLPGHTSATATVLNSQGVAAGYSYGDAGAVRGVLWPVTTA